MTAITATARPRISWGPALRWVALVIAVGFIVITMRDGWGEISQATAVMLAGKTHLILAALALESVWTFSLAQVYRSGLGAFGGTVRHRDALRVSMGAFTLSRVLPGGGVVGGLLAAKEFVRVGNPGPLTLLSLVTAGWVSLVALTGILTIAVGGAVAAGILAGPYLTVPASLLAGLVTFGVVVSLGLRRGRFRQRMARLVRKVFGRWSPGMGLPEIEAALGDGSGFRLRRLAPVAMWAATAWVLDAAALWLVFTAFGFELSLGALAVGYGAANLLQALPELTPGWLGVLEGSLAVTYAAFGVPAALATAAVLGYRLLSFWLPVAAGIPFGLDIMRKHGRAPAPVVAS